MRIQGVNDLNSNCVICQLAGLSKEGTDARWQTCVRLSHECATWPTFRRLIVKYRGDFNICTRSVVWTSTYAWHSHS